MLLKANHTIERGTKAGQGKDAKVTVETIKPGEEFEETGKAAERLIRIGAASAVDEDSAE